MSETTTTDRTELARQIHEAFEAVMKWAVAMARKQELENVAHSHETERVDAEAQAALDAAWALLGKPLADLDGNKFAIGTKQRLGESFNGAASHVARGAVGRAVADMLACRAIMDCKVEGGEYVPAAKHILEHDDGAEAERAKGNESIGGAERQPGDPDGDGGTTPEASGVVGTTPPTAHNPYPLGETDPNVQQSPTEGN